MTRADLDLDELDDVADRDELRQRYYGLLQELRVVLPGIQVILGFLLTVPFTDRFERLDRSGKGLLLGATVGAGSATVLLMTPAVFHRVAHRRSRRDRLRWAIRVARIGFVTFAVSLLMAFACVTRASYDDRVAIAVTVAIAGLLLVLWLVIPLSIRRNADGHADRQAGPADLD